jgi:hypothetical protein
MPFGHGWGATPLFKNPVFRATFYASAPLNANIKSHYEISGLKVLSTRICF